ncbi:leucine-rich repeat domain-containing protein [Chamaesiphon minutus]|uniref:Leucine Rich Repeat (LRR)-containing protein n=1 Tax=Chamaesiphon minutus (strain ATCC 27169 / PCC 6605) TaxID=1173020 RepID=K9ULW6_CHAP6|nr:leucine-rich repeat domain-containing protein [Chamaesiphon minutus]AFY95194.1 Leucine Rich Repeat (LRR)-containing protein [Chamaesiphon minutus PCC 6605]
MIDFALEALIDRAIQDRITHLDLYQQRLTQLPARIVDIHSLVSLRVSDNELITLPENIGNLSSLRELRLYKNQLSALPGSISHLTNLVSLSLSFNKFKIFPDIIASLINLKELKLNGNQIDILPESLLQLKKLVSIDLSSNPIFDLSILQSLPNLNHVKFLGVNLPCEYWVDLSKSTFIIRSNNDGSTSEIELPNANKLSLNLRKQNLIILSNEIGVYKWCQHLKLSHNYLNSLPDNIDELSNLSHLKLLNNQLTSLPESVGDLEKLISLDLRRNKLTELPDSIGNLKNLKYLYLDDNLLEKLPATIGNLKQLEYLHLSANKLTSLPEELGECKKLSYLDVRFNQIVKLESSIGKLSNLIELDAFRNKIASLPDEIGGLCNLQHLQLDENHIKKLPETLKMLSKLTSISLIDNPVSDISILQDLPRLNKVNWLNTVRFPHQYWTKLSESRSEGFIGECNEEIRRRLIKKEGYGGYGIICKCLQSQMLDVHRKYTLLKIDSSERLLDRHTQTTVPEQLVLLKMHCSSNHNNIHIIQVPSEVTSIEVAIAWVNNENHFCKFISQI